MWYPRGKTEECALLHPPRVTAESSGGGDGGGDGGGGGGGGRGNVSRIVAAAVAVAVLAVLAGLAVEPRRARVCHHT